MRRVLPSLYLILRLLAVSSTGNEIEPKDCNGRDKCISKCCERGHAYNTTSLGCVKYDGALNITVWKDGEEMISPVPQNFTVIDTFVCPNGSTIEMQAPGARIGLNWNEGTAMLKKSHQLFMWEKLSSDMYCVDNMLPELLPGDGLICRPEKSQQQDPLRTYKAYGMLVSSILLGLTALMYVCVPKLRDIAGLTLLPYLVTLMGAFVSVSSLLLINPLAPFHKTLCFSMTLLAYFCILSAFFWLNVKCFDLSRIFAGPFGRAVRNSCESATVKFPRRRFCAYCIWGFGLPAAATTVLATIESLEDTLPDYIVTPKIRQTCFPTGSEKLIWMDIPIIVLCLTNAVFFTITWRGIGRSRIRSDSRKLVNHRLNQRKLFLELFLLTGMPWLFEVGSYLFPHRAWLITDLINSLIGIPIFFILMSKKRVTQFVRHFISTSRSFSTKTTPMTG